MLSVWKANWMEGKQDKMAALPKEALCLAQLFLPPSLLHSFPSPAPFSSFPPFPPGKMKMFRSRQECHIGVGEYGPSVPFRPLRGWSPAAFGHLPPLLGFLSCLAPSSHHCWVSGLGSRPEAGCVAPRLAGWCSRFH